MTNLPQLAHTYRPSRAILRGDSYIPIGRGTGLATRPFERGDTTGEDKRELAIAQARSERELLEPGSPRDKLYALQEALGKLPAGVDFPLQHLFPPGLYLRTIRLPAGSMLVGKIHKHRHGNILSMGRVRVYTEYGGTEEFEGPLQMISEPGTKRAVLALTNAVWTTIHLNPTNTQNLAELEADIIAKSYDEYESFVKEQQP